MAEPMTPAEIGRLGRSAVDKVDRYGQRGITLLSMNEIEALVMIAVISGLLPPTAGADVNETTISATEKTNV